MEKMLKKGHIGFIAKLYRLEGQVEEAYTQEGLPLEGRQQEELQLILERYLTVF